MFVRYFSELVFPLATVEEALLRDPEQWLPGLAVRAEERGQDLLVEVGFGSPGRRVARSVLIEVGEPMRFPSRTVLPMTWKAASKESLFPTLEADLEVGVLGPNRTQLSVSARYKPPLGAVGRAIDKTLLHRVAEASIKDFVDRVTERLQGMVGTPPTGNRVSS